MDGRFFTNCVRNIIENAVSICVIIPQNRKVRKVSTSHYRSKFRAQRYGDKLPKKVGKPWRTKGGAHVMQAWCRNDLQTSYQTRTGRQTHVMWTPRDHLDYRRRDNIQRSSPQNTGRAKTVTTLRLEECDFGHALGARTFYTSLLRKCQKHRRRHSVY